MVQIAPQLLKLSPAALWCRHVRGSSCQLKSCTLSGGWRIVVEAPRWSGQCRGTVPPACTSGSSCPVCKCSLCSTRSKKQMQRRHLLALARWSCSAFLVQMSWSVFTIRQPRPSSKTPVAGVACSYGYADDSFKCVDLLTTLP